MVRSDRTLSTTLASEPQLRQQARRRISIKNQGSTLREWLTMVDYAGQSTMVANHRDHDRSYDCDRYCDRARETRLP
jgi:hypothetical protein